MNCKRFHLVASLVIAAAGLLGCGGGSSGVDGIDGTGQAVPAISYGRLSSFGSVEVNGVHYDTAGATFLIDGVAASQFDLDLGDIVLVEGQAEPGASRGVAQQVTSDHVLLGRAESVASDGQSLVALGQTVKVDDQTIFGAEIASGLSSLSAGDAISVSGFRNAAGDILATRVERQKAGVVMFKTAGALSALDTSNKRLQINGLQVDYSGAILLPADAESLLALGAFVEVKAAAAAAGQAFAATSVEIKRKSVPGAADANVNVEGYVTSFGPADATRFNVDGLQVLTTKTTTRVGTLATNALVRVKGVVSPVGAVVAKEVRTTFTPPGATQLVEGRVFDASLGPIADARVDIFVQLPGGSGYSLTWAQGGTPLRTGADGHFTAMVPPGSLLLINGGEPGFVQPCAVFKEANDGFSFDVELVAESTLDAFNPPPPQSAAGAITTTGTIYELVAGSREPVPGARVWIGDGTGFTYATTLTDRDGHYLACNLPNDVRWPWGSELAVQKAGFADASVPAIDPSRSTVVDVEMKRQ